MLKEKVCWHHKFQAATMTSHDKQSIKVTRAQTLPPTCNASKPAITTPLRHDGGNWQETSMLATVNHSLLFCVALKSAP